MTVIQYFSPLEGIQGLLLLGALAVALLCRRRLPRPVLGGEMPAAGFRPYPAIAIVAGACAVTRILLNLHFGPPVPTIVDETSILLQAETLAHGHLALPPHPMADWLESAYVNHRPAYASMYAIGRGLPMALALLVGLEPWYGLVAANFVAAITIVWAARKYVSDMAAFGAGALFAIKFGTFSYFATTYHSPVLTVIGATLVAGGYRQFTRDQAWSAAAMLGLGSAFLLLTRPYEGLLFLLPFCVGIAWRLIRTPEARGRIFAGGAVVAAFVVAAASLTALHDKATTGSAFETPYNLYARTWTKSPPFIIQPKFSDSRPPRSKALAEYVRLQDSHYDKSETPGGFIRAQLYRMVLAFTFYIGVVLAPAFFFGLYLLRRQYALLGGCLATLLGSMLVTWQHVHYVAPIMFAVMLCTARGLEGLFQRRGNLALLGRLYAGSGAMSVALLLPVGVALLLLAPSLAQLFPPLGGRMLIWQMAPDSHRLVEKRLLALPGRDLVIVANDATHAANTVFNEALIDQSEIVWATDDERGNGALLSYYRGRKVWTLDWPDGRLRLRPMPPPPPTPGAAPLTAAPARP